MGWIFMLPMWQIALASVAGVLLLAALCLLVARTVCRWLSADDRSMARSYFAMAGTFTGLLLALLTVMVHEDWDAARDAVSKEADAIGDLYMHVQWVGITGEQTTKEVIRRYIRAVIEHEWLAMAHGADSDRAWRLFYDLNVQIGAMTPKTPREVSAYRQVLDSLDTMADRRRDRLSKSGTNLPATMWTLLFASIVITLGYAVLMPTRPTQGTWGMLAALAVLIGLVLSVMVALNAPFGGGLAIGSTEIESLLDEFDRFSDH